MDIFRQHEVFEIEVLDRMNSDKLLEPLVFGGGTMLRLCHELNRYSANLDFWFIQSTPQQKYFEKMQTLLSASYEVTDAQVKHYTLLCELRSAHYPKRLKIEVRKEVNACDYQKSIAFSKFSTKQVLVNAHTLNQTMRNKILAFLDRGEIRDCFDIEFLIRRGVRLAVASAAEADALETKVASLRDIDFRVKLGSILEEDYREYYIENGFSLLKKKLAMVRPE